MVTVSVVAAALVGSTSATAENVVVVAATAKNSLKQFQLL
jgi:hypothetical protein